MGLESEIYIDHIPTTRRLEKDPARKESLERVSTCPPGGGKQKQSKRNHSPPSGVSLIRRSNVYSGKGKQPSQPVPAEGRGGNKISAEEQRSSREPRPAKAREALVIPNSTAKDPTYAASQDVLRTEERRVPSARRKPELPDQRAKPTYVDPGPKRGVDTQYYDSYRHARRFTPRKDLNIPINVRDKVLQAVSGTSPHAPKKKLYKIAYDCHWTLPAVLRDQFDLGQKLSDIVTLTGTGRDAQAATCSEYISQSWPHAGSLLLEAIERSLLSGRKNAGKSSSGLA
jgi:hypothetical protein